MTKLTNFSVPCEFKIDFFGMSKNVMTFFYHVHNKILGDTTTGSAPNALKASCPLELRWIQLPYSFPFVE